jgi:hypothetical protein
MSTALRTIFVFLLALALVSAYEKIDGYNELMAFHEENSQYVIVHIYHNRHFSKSRQF